jgi:3-phenylpropionate/trans-cinnamate dioxygenase alpha subunit
MAHESQVPNPGDFFLNFMGEDRVIVVRDNDMGLQVLVNSCRHRGNAVCRADEGHSSSFMCTYHGWTYDLKGNLVGVPGFKEVYHEELDRENWGLIKAGQVESYKGFIFATMDGEAPTRMITSERSVSWHRFLAQRANIAAVPGISKYVIPATEVRRQYLGLLPRHHPQSSAMAGFMARRQSTPNSAKSMFVRPQITFLGDWHASVDHSTRQDGGHGHPSGVQWMARTA